MTVTDSDPVARASQAASPSRPPADPRACGDPTKPSRAEPSRAEPAGRGIGVPTHPRRPRKHRRAGRTLAAFAAAAALVLAPLLTAPAYAADPTPTPTPSPAPTLSGSVEAYVSTLRSGVVEKGRPLDVQVSISNGTGYAVAASTATVRVGKTAITSRTALTTWLNAEGSANGFAELGSTTIRPVDSGTIGTGTLTVAADDPVLDKLTPGVHPLQATVKTPSTTHTAIGVIVVSDPARTERTPVGLVVPITAGPTAEGLLTAEQLTTLTALDGDLTTTLNAVAGTSAILAIDPAIPASIRVLGSAAPESATAWLERLNMLPNERFALQFGDADVAVQLAGGASAPLSPTSLQSYMNPDDFRPDPDASPAPTPTDTATPTTAPDQPVYPTLAELEDLGPNTRGTVFWPFSGTADGKTLQTLAATSTDDTTALTLIPSSTTAVGAKGATVAAHAIANKADVLVYDSTVSDQLATAATLDPPLRGSSLAAASAYLQLAASGAGTHPLLVAVDRPASRSGLSAAVQTVTRVPATTAATLATLTAAATQSVTVQDAAARPQRLSAFNGLSDGEHALALFSSILDDPTVLTGPERASILQLLGSGWLADENGWSAAIATHEQGTDTTLASVEIAPSSALNLAGSSAPLRFGVRNDLPWPVHVNLRAAPDDLRLEVQTSTPVDAQANSTTRVTVPVRAKIGSGQVTLDLSLYSPTGVAIGDPQSVNLNVHADWEVIGLSVLGVGIGAFLVVGLVRTILARRRRRAEGGAGEGGA
ncbi:DUF6049 family protein [Microbacterium sp.]|uniref:DUF6049 family protein n=1 Tax=Microbacterium sp. TaxID=51671 RepID=UPI003A94FDF6